jgi:DNA-binding MarR family transcriptional regulator
LELARQKGLLAMQFKREESAGFLVNHLARTFATALQAGLKPLHLAPAQFMVLIELWQEGGLSQRQLIDRLTVEQATMANTLNRMERDGLIERKPSPQDGRVQLIYPTQRALELEAEAKTRAQAINQLALSGFTNQERQAFFTGISRVMANLWECLDSSGK